MANNKGKHRHYRVDQWNGAMWVRYLSTTDKMKAISAYYELLGQGVEARLIQKYGNKGVED